MDKYQISRVFSLIVAAFLVFTFYVLLAANVATGRNFMTDMILIVIAIALLAIFSSVQKIESKIGGKRK